MPAPIICPHCREELDIPAEYRGRPVRCGNCQTVFAPTPDAGPPVVRPRPSVPRPSARRSDDDRDRDGRPPRRSNAPVWLLLLFTVFTVGGCCGGFTLVFFVQVNPTLTPHASAEGKFKVEFPGDTPAEGPTTNPADPAIKGVEASARRDFGQEFYQVKCYDLKAEWRNLPAQEALRKVATAELESLVTDSEQRKPVQQELTKHQGFDALDVLAGNGNGFTGRDTMLRCVRVGDRVYVVVYQAQKVQPEYWWVRQFFQSVEFTDPPPVPKEKE